MDDNGDLIRISPTSVISVERPGGDAIGNINNNQLHMIYGCVWKWRIDPQDVIKHGFLENIPVLKKTRFPYLDGLFSSGISQLATFDFLRLNIRVDHGLSLTWNIRAKPPPPHLIISPVSEISPPKKFAGMAWPKKFGIFGHAYLKPSKFYDHPGVAEARPRGSQGLEPSQPSLQKPRPQWVQLSLVAVAWDAWQLDDITDISMSIIL